MSLRKKISGRFSCSFKNEGAKAKKIFAENGSRNIVLSSGTLIVSIFCEHKKSPVMWSHIHFLCAKLYVHRHLMLTTLNGFCFGLRHWTLGPLWSSQKYPFNFWRKKNWNFDHFVAFRKKIINMSFFQSWPITSHSIRTYFIAVDHNIEDFDKSDKESDLGCNKTLKIKFSRKNENMFWFWYEITIFSIDLMVPKVLI